MNAATNSRAPRTSKIMKAASTPSPRGTIDRSADPAAVSVRPARRQDGEDRLPEDLQVERERPVLDVVEVEPDAVLPGQVGPAADLPQPRDARLHQQPAVHVGGVVGDLTRQ